MGKGGEWLEVVSRITFHEAELKLRVRDFTYCRTTNSAMLAPVLDRFKRKLQYIMPREAPPQLNSTKSIKKIKVYATRKRPRCGFT